MAKKFLLPLIGALLALSACSGGNDQSSSSSSGSESSSDTSVSESSSTSESGTSTGDSTASESSSDSETSESESSSESSDSSSSSSSLDVNTDPFVPGDTTNEEEYDYDNIIVNQPTNELAEDFAYGVDLSIVKELENLGAKYYDKDGKEEDVFKILYDGGSNYCRLRLWVDPYDGDGNPYGGGTNDLATDIYLARRAQNAGMKVCIDFHLSDSWCDPGKQHRPKSWQTSMMTSQVPVHVGEYIQESLQYFKDYGVTVDSFQVGNETNSGVCGFSISTSSSNLTMPFNVYKYGIAGGKEVFPEAKAIIHLTNIRSNAAVKLYLDRLEEYEVDYDIAGFSYYPYWHGTHDNLLDILTYAANKGKETMVMETAWGFTDEQNEVVSNQYSSTGFGTAGGYETSTQAQATELADIIDVLSQVPNQKGTGIFYWEPAWLPTPGTGWITKEGAFYNDYGRDPSSDVDFEALEDYTSDYCKASWSNQAVFSYTGKVLPSAYTYKYIQDGSKTAEEYIVGLVSDNLTHTINLKDESTLDLPTSVKMKTNTDAHRNVSVTWDEEQYDEMVASGDGVYVIDGVTETGVSVKCTVTVETNFVSDPSFENQTGSGEEIPVSEPWSLTCSPEGSARIEAKSEGNRTGTKYFHWYNASTFTWDLSQTIEMDQSGTFALRTYIMSNTAIGYDYMDMYYSINGGDEVAMSVLYACQGWVADLQSGMILAELDGIEITSGDTITIGMRCSGLAASWGHMDDWSLVKYTPTDPTTVYGLQDGSFETQNAVNSASTPWSVENTGSPDELGIFSNGNAIDGTDCFHWYSTTAFTFTLKQTFVVEKAGTYALSTNLNTAAYDSGFNEAYISYQIGEGEEVQIALDATSLPGWVSGGTTWSQAGIEVPDDLTSVTIKLYMDCKAESWGHNDVWAFAEDSSEEPVDPEPEEPTVTYGIQNASFENDWDLSSTSSPWSITEGSTGVNIASAGAIDVGDGGTHYLNWWSDSSFNFTLQQTFTVEEAGTYTLGTYFISEAYDTAYNSASISYKIGDAEAIVIALDGNTLAGWNSTPTHWTQEGIVVENAETEVTISLMMDCKAGGWGQNDLWSFEQQAA